MHSAWHILFDHEGKKTHPYTNKRMKIFEMLVVVSTPSTPVQRIQLARAALDLCRVVIKLRREKYRRDTLRRFIFAYECEMGVY